LVAVGGVRESRADLLVGFLYRHNRQETILAVKPRDGREGAEGKLALGAKS